MDSSVDVAVVVCVVVSYGFNDLAWLLGCGCVVKVDKGVTIDFPV